LEEDTYEDKEDIDYDKEWSDSDYEPPASKVSMNGVMDGMETCNCS